MPVCCVAPHLSSLRRTYKVRLIPRDLRALPPEHFTALSKNWYGVPRFPPDSPDSPVEQENLERHTNYLEEVRRKLPVFITF